MPVIVGSTVAHFEITAKIGEGGMGEVYRATDTKLGREVAFKVLPEEMASDPERLSRFQREAQTVAALNHPNIVTLFSVESVGGVHFLTMELLEGKTLAESISRGGMSVGQFFRTSIPLTAALSAAHEIGVVHRDLKPGNVIITNEGVLKVIDFGLAKLTPAQVSAFDTGATTEPLTGEGRILGTVPYMSPEQVQGRPLDHRSDIFSLGIILYQMATGDRPFKGATSAEIHSSILRDTPDPVDHLNREVPHHVARMIRLCLEKDPDSRLQSAKDVHNELSFLQEEISTGEFAARPDAEAPGRRPRLPLYLLAGVLLLVGVYAAWQLATRRSADSEPLPTVRFEVSMPEGERLAHMHQHGLAIAPDGRRLAFVSGTVDHPDRNTAETQIYLRALESWNSQPVPGTEGGFLPFFSPDGKWMAFATSEPRQAGRPPRVLLKKIPMGGGRVTTICSVELIAGATWSADDTIVIGKYRGGLQTVPATGGEPEALTELDTEAGELSHRLPHFLPAGGGVLYTATLYEESAVRVYSPRTGKHKQLIDNAMDARYVESGHLVYARAGNLLAVPFDPETHEILGPEVLVLDGVSHSIGGHGFYRTGAAQFSVGGSGMLALARGSAMPERKRSLLLVDRLGNETSLDVEKKDYSRAFVAADGRSILLSTSHPPWAVWLFDLDRGTLTRQTFDEKEGASAIWGPGTNEFTYHTARGQLVKPVLIESIGSGPEEGTLLTSGHLMPASWSPNGEYLAAEGAVEGPYATQGDIWIIHRDGKAEPFLQTKYHEGGPRFSPDGRWIAYWSAESGRSQVYARSFPGPGVAIQISVAGGHSPAWSQDGQEIFFLDATTSSVYSAKLRDVDGGFVPARPVELIKRPHNGFDVTQNGRLLLISPEDEGSLTTRLDALMPARIQVVENWAVELKRRVPRSR